MVVDDDKNYLYSELREIVEEVSKQSNSSQNEKFMTKDSARSIGNLPITAKETLLVIIATISIVSGGAFTWAKFSSYVEVTMQKQQEISEEIENVEGDIRDLRNRIHKFTNFQNRLEWRLDSIESKLEGEN